MAVAEILKTINGFYEPTGVYSFEFRESSTGDLITEIYFLLPPESVSVSEAQRSDLQPTLTGGYLTDFGNEFKQITVQGSTHFFYGGTTRLPAKEYGSSKNLGVAGFIDGYDEYLKLRFMIMRYRDYTLTNDGRLHNEPTFTSLGLADVSALGDHVRASLVNGNGVLADQIDMIWHDYDYDDHWRVKINDFSTSRTKEDPWSIMYTINMTAFEQDNRKPSMTDIFAFSRRKPNSRQLIQQTFEFTGDVSAFTKPDSVEIPFASGVVSVPSIGFAKVEPATTLTDASSL